MSGDEIFEIVDDHGFVVGCAPRRLCHDDPSLIHRCSHVVVYHPDGRILLQKRSSSKDIQPGKWDTAVGGHLQPGEDFESAALREMTEELGIPDTLPLRHICDTKIRNEKMSASFPPSTPAPSVFRQKRLTKSASGQKPNSAPPSKQPTRPSLPIFARN